MQTEHLQTRQISQEAFDWYLRYLGAIDDKDIDAYGTFLAENCVMVQNNQEPVVGKASILAGLRQYWASFQSMEHDLLNIYGTDHAFALEANNIYTRLDGRKVTARAVALTTRNPAGLATSFHFYTNVSAVFQPA